MIKRNWTGNPSCSFCFEMENINHLFGCSAAKYIWSILSKCLGAKNRPVCFTQYFWWLPRFIPINRNLQIVGLAAIFWANWKLRHRACFDHKLVRSPAEFIWYAYSFMHCWAGLQNAEEQVLLEQGATAFQDEALAIHNNGRGERTQRLLLEDQDKDDDTEEVAEHDDEACKIGDLWRPVLLLVSFGEL